RPQSENATVINGTFDVGRRTDALGGEFHHIAHRIHHDPHNAIAQVEDDDHGKAVVVGLRAVELQAHIDDGNDGAAEIDYTLDEGRGVSDPRGRLVAADFLHLQDVDAVLFLIEPEGQVCPGT